MQSKVSKFVLYTFMCVYDPFSALLIGKSYFLSIRIFAIFVLTYIPFLLVKVNMNYSNNSCQSRDNNAHKHELKIFILTDLNTLLTLTYCHLHIYYRKVSHSSPASSFALCYYRSLIFILEIMQICCCFSDHCWLHIT